MDKQFREQTKPPSDYDYDTQHRKILPQRQREPKPTDYDRSKKQSSSNYPSSFGQDQQNSNQMNVFNRFENKSREADRNNYQPQPGPYYSNQQPQGSMRFEKKNQGNSSKGFSNRNNTQKTNIDIQYTQKPRQEIINKYLPKTESGRNEQPNFGVEGNTQSIYEKKRDIPFKSYETKNYSRPTNFDHQGSLRTTGQDKFPKSFNKEHQFGIRFTNNQHQNQYQHQHQNQQFRFVDKPTPNFTPKPNRSSIPTNQSKPRNQSDMFENANFPKNNKFMDLTAEEEKFIENDFHKAYTSYGIDKMEIEKEEVFTVKCSYCDDPFPVDVLEAHEEECDAKKIPCKICGEKVLMDIYDFHAKECKKKARNANRIAILASRDLADSGLMQILNPSELFGIFNRPAAPAQAGGSLQTYEELLALDENKVKVGLTDEELKRFPLITFLEKGDEDTVCNICLGEFEMGDTLRKLGCNHEFHRSCVDTWLKENTVCPVCKKYMR